MLIIVDRLQEFGLLPFGDEVVDDHVAKFEVVHQLTAHSFQVTPLLVVRLVQIIDFRVD